MKSIGTIICTVLFFTSLCGRDPDWKEVKRSCAVNSKRIRPSLSLCADAEKLQYESCVLDKLEEFLKEQFEKRKEKAFARCLEDMLLRNSFGNPRGLRNFKLGDPDLRDLQLCIPFLYFRILREVLRDSDFPKELLAMRHAKMHAAGNDSERIQDAKSYLSAFMRFIIFHVYGYSQDPYTKMPIQYEELDLDPPTPEQEMEMDWERSLNK